LFASLCEFAAWLAVRRIYALGHCRAAILQDRRKQSGREVAPPQRHKNL
jgi:hypothetical protein